MDNVNVLLGVRLEEALKRQIADIDKRIKIYDAADLVGAKLRGTASAEDHEKFVSWLREAEIIILLIGAFPVDLLADTPKLRWLQLAPS